MIYTDFCKAVDIGLKASEQEPVGETDVKPTGRPGEELTLLYRRVCPFRMSLASYSP
jgi:hypothetical protein